MPPPISERQVQRFAELTALGLTRNEAAKATDISTRSADRFLADASFRKRVADLREPDAATAVAAVLRDLLSSTDERMRAKGAELALRFPDATRTQVDDPLDELPEGCSVLILYPSSRDEEPEPDEPDPTTRAASDAERLLYGR